ncbi:MAG: non-canonical purine NTP pyrophosphatase [Actinomycetota bacterium]|nr:non-canonical purine NTP pyrophosphatase [Actinomycetota bacterium]
MPGWDVELLAAGALPEERGASFYENARGKAAFARETVDPGAWVLGEDSGLEVDGLGGKPGIRSARYAGADASDVENVAKLLAELEGIEGEGRRARYVCQLVCLAPDSQELRATGTLAGRIAPAPRGVGGFGYDPIFVPEGETRTVGELGNGWKARRSHRAAAARALRDAILRELRPV